MVCIRVHLNTRASINTCMVYDKHIELEWPLNFLRFDFSFQFNLLRGSAKAKRSNQ